MPDTSPPWLARWRARAGLTQQALADRLGTRQPSISSIESLTVYPSVGLFLSIIEVCAPPDDEILAAVKELRGVRRKDRGAERTAA